MRETVLGLALSFAACVPPTMTTPVYVSPPPQPSPPPEGAARTEPGTFSETAGGEYAGAFYDEELGDDHVAQAASADLPASVRFVRVSIVNALIGPGKVDGTMWDGPGQRVDQETISSLSSALVGTSPYAAAAAVMAGLAQTALDKPDPKGYATLEASQGSQTVDMPRDFRDTFTPLWRSAVFDRVDLSGQPRVRVVLLDADALEDDAIATVEITSQDLQAALRAGTVYQVPVSEQSMKQLLFVGISVMAIE